MAPRRHASSHRTRLPASMCGQATTPGNNVRVVTQTWRARAVLDEHVSAASGGSARQREPQQTTVLSSLQLCWSWLPSRACSNYPKHCFIPQTGPWLRARARGHVPAVRIWRAQRGDRPSKQGRARPPASVIASAWEPPPLRRRLLSGVWTIAARTAVGMLATWASHHASVQCSTLVTGPGHR